MPNCRQTPFSQNSLPDLTGRVIIVTGGNQGIGRTTVEALAAKGAKVYIATRNPERGRQAVEEIRQENQDSKVEFLKLDLAELGSVEEAVKEFLAKEDKLHILINNAGIMAVPYAEASSGYEIQFATNYLGHFRLTQLLLPTLISTAESAPKNSVRIVNLTSDGHDLLGHKDGISFENINLKDHSPWTRYGQSKMANLLHVKALTKRYGEKGIWVAGVHPGIVATELLRGTGVANNPILGKPIKWLAKTFGNKPEMGCLTTLYCATSEDVGEGDSGLYWVPTAKKGKPNKMAEDEALADRLWEWSLEVMEKRV